MAALSARMPARSHSWLPDRVLRAVPVAPLAAVLAIGLVVGTARLMFTGTITVTPSPSSVAEAGVGGTAAAQEADMTPARSGTVRPSAVLVVEGFGTYCCDGGDGLRVALHGIEPGTVVRQFSYRGLDASGNPLHSGPASDDLPLPELGDKIAAQVGYLHRVTGGRVSVVAESEGTLGVYAMLARHHGLPIASVVLLSPIVDPGQLTFSPAGSGGGSVPSAALAELDHLIGTMSPYGDGGAQQLLASVSQFGARYFSGVDSGGPVRWLGVIPLADALTLPACDLPPGVLVVPAFHGGLLDDPEVLPVVARFIAGETPVTATPGQERLRAASQVISRTATAWRMLDTSTPTCPDP
jgi:hypothetical protein